MSSAENFTQNAKRYGLIHPYGIDDVLDKLNRSIGKIAVSATSKKSCYYSLSTVAEYCTIQIIAIRRVTKSNNAIGKFNNTQEKSIIFAPTLNNTIGKSTIFTPTFQYLLIKFSPSLVWRPHKSVIGKQCRPRSDAIYLHVIPEV